MAFWSSQKLRQELPSLISPYDPLAVEQASYTLKIGNQIFVTKDHRNSNDPHTKKNLSPNEDFVIPAGQFAFLLTKESVIVPSDAIAFISMKARIKYKGLINISGFHVDPGFSGNLLFSVYNAGPNLIRLCQNQPCFLIWYASLNEPDSLPKTNPGFSDIPIDVLNQISSTEIYSLQALSEEFREVESKVNEKLIEVNSINDKINKTNVETEKLATRIKWWGQGLLAAITIILSVIATVVTYVGSTFVNSAKFAIENHEFITKFMIYKKTLDDLVKKQADSQELIAPPGKSDSKK